MKDEKTCVYIKKIFCRVKIFFIFLLGGEIILKVPTSDHDSPTQTELTIDFVVSFHDH